MVDPPCCVAVLDIEDGEKDGAFGNNLGNRWLVLSACFVTGLPMLTPMMYSKFLKTRDVAGILATHFRTRQHVPEFISFFWSATISDTQNKAELIIHAIREIDQNIGRTLLRQCDAGTTRFFGEIIEKVHRGLNEVFETHDVMSPSADGVNWSQYIHHGATLLRSLMEECKRNNYGQFGTIPAIRPRSGINTRYASKTTSAVHDKDSAKDPIMIPQNWREH